ncbi:NUDIX hydrolase [Amycolatopsis sp. 195334CR]|uniref:NUDIX hydrolase n=1 Tax=Amycolatopsis sp. 195334CR TaxID=2814588 RepID=UPI001F5D4767|nr:NUDIX hydrolase [Amycolatopsis sp. 195334CR]
MNDEETKVRAAGAVLWRHGADGPEVAVVHRPRYDDWSLPKGKLDPGETTVAAAVRELHEETGFHVVLGRFLKQVAYRVPAPGGRGGTVGKTVDYFSARVAGGAFEPNEEVDELRWLRPAEAEPILSRHGDVETLREFCALPAELSTVLLVRHAKAGKRDEWTGDDDLRPLSNAGLRQAEGVRAVSTVFGPDRVLSAPRLRCVQTVAKVAEDLGAEVRQEHLLSEEGYWADPVLGLARFLAIAGDGGTPLICSQGGVIPDLVTQLAERDGVQLELRSHVTEAEQQRRPAPAKKGSLWLLSFRPAAGNDGNDGPRLAAATYFASQLPSPSPLNSAKGE